MKKLLWGLGGLVVLLLAVALAAPFFIPTSVIVDRVVAAAKSATGRDLRIEGPVRISLIPRVELEAEQVAFANAQGASSPQMATLKRLQVALRPLPLLSGEVDIDRFVLVEPVIHLEIDAQGKPNWQFGETGAQPQAQPGGTPPAAPDEKTRATERRLQELRLGEVRIENGLVTYTDRRSNRHEELRDVDLAVSLPGLEAKASIDGALTWKEKRIELAAGVDRARAVLDGTKTPLTLRVKGEPLALSVTGTAALPTIDATVALDVPSVRGLLAWVGDASALPEGGFGKLALEGKLQVDQAGNFGFADAKLALDAIAGTGALRVDRSGARPRIEARLALDSLDLNPYLPEAPAKPQAAQPAPGTQAPAAAAPSQPAAGDWSDAPIELAGLRAVDAQLDLAAKAIHYKKLLVDSGALAVRLDNGRLVADLKDLALYQGTGAGRIELAERSGAAALGLSFRLANVAAEQLLAALAEFDKITGTANLELDVNGAGKSQRAIIGALGGKGAASFTNGTLKGVDLARIARNIGGGAEGGATEFSELKGTFNIERGIVHNNDLLLVSPLLRIEGAGTVDLPHRTLSYKLSPKGDLAQLGVAIVVEGPWTKPAYRPDLGNLPGRLLQGLQPREPAPPAGSATPGSPAPAPGAPPKPADILRGLLRPN